MSDIVSLLKGSDWVKRETFNEKLGEINKNAAAAVELALLEKGIAAKASTATYLVTIPAAWVGTGPYTQTVNVSGILASDNPTVDIVLSGVMESDEAQLEAWGLVSRIVTQTGSIVVTCYEDKPTVGLLIQMKVVR